MALSPGSGDGREVLREFLERRTGFAIPADRWEFLAPRFLGRLSARGFRSVTDYVRYLEHDPLGPTELDELFCALTVRKTAFFRNRGCFAALAGVLPELCRARSTARPVAMWSAGCATGEETWSMAMVARAALPEDGPSYYLLGTDIVQEALARAREGAYPAASLEEVPPEYRRFLTPTGARMWVRQELREATEFAPHNLVGDPYPRPAGGLWDVVLCRNVLIYFGLAQAREVLDRLEAVVAPGGCLFLGHAEVFTDVAPAWEVVFRGDTFFYRRRAEEPVAEPPTTRIARPPEPTPAPSAFHEAPTERFSGLPAGRGQTPTRAFARGAGSRRYLPDFGEAGETRADVRPGEEHEQELQEARRLLATGDAEGAARILRAVVQRSPGLARARLLLAEVSERLGQHEAALRQTETAVELAPLDPWAHCRLGRLRLLLGNPGRAEASLRRALYLEPDLLPARWSLAEALRLSGRVERAGRELRNVLRTLRTLTPERAAQLGGGEPAHELRRRCEGALADLGMAEGAP